MATIRIVLGYATEHRKSVPVVLAVAFDQKAVQAAVDAAPASIKRFEIGAFFFQRKGRRSGGAPEVLEEQEGTEVTEGEIGRLRAELEKEIEKSNQERLVFEGLLSEVQADRDKLLGELAALQAAVKPASLASPEESTQNSPVTPIEAAPPNEPAGGGTPPPALDGDGPQLLPSTSAPETAAGKKNRR